MKKILMLSMLLLIIAFSSQAQRSIVQDANGNYVSTYVKDTTQAKSTGKYFIDSKGVEYPIYLTAKGKMFIHRTSKTGNQYKQYLKL